jgi:hypothetical protein
MAKITEVVSSLAVKVNVGDYQSVDFFTSLKAEVEPTEDAARVGRALNDLCNSNMIANLLAHFAGRGKKLTTAEVCKRYGLKPPKEPEFG